MTRAPASTRRVVALVALGALAGAGLGGAATAYRASHREFGDAGTRDAFLKIPVGGPAVGEWTMVEGEETRTGVLENDPSAPDMFRWTPSDGRTVPRSRERVARYLVGADPDQFLANYAPKGAAAHRTDAGRPITVVRWARADGSAGPERVLTLDDESGELVGIEDHAYDGTQLRCARLSISVSVTRRTRPPTLVPTTECASPCDLDVPFPVYEPSRLPAGYRRVYCAYITPARSIPPHVLLRYGDGLAQIDLFLMRPESLDGLVAFAQRLQRSAAAEVCPSSGDTPEDLVEGTVVIRRRSDRCRTVLQRQDLPDVCAVLVAFNEVPANLYVEMMRSLAPVAKASK